MSVTNGQKISASVTNSAYVSKTADSTVVSKINLSRSGSGTTITDTQQVVNKLLDVVGTTEADATPNNYSSSNFITNGDNRKVAIGKLDTQLATTNTTANTAASTNTTQDTRLTALESGTMTISGNKTFSGNVSFTGTTTSVSTADLDVTDKNITVNKNGNDATSEGAGLTADRTGTKGSIIYKTASPTKWALGNLGSEVNAVDESTAQILSNKQSVAYDYIEQGSDPATPASGLRRIYSKADGFYERSSAGTIKKLGAGGSGSGVINLIENGDAETAVGSIFTPYADSGSRPTDGVGGSPTVTTSLNTGGILTGLNSFILSKPASNCQGQGWADQFEISNTYKAKSLKIAIDYTVSSGTFVAGSSTTDSDIIWYIFDVTNSKLIEPSNIKMFSNSSTLSDKFEAEFQTSATGSVYRLIAHVATTSALAYEIAVDNVTVTPQNYVYGSVLSDWQTYTPTGSWTTNTTYAGKYKRIGDSMRVEVYITLAGAPTAANLTINVPFGLQIDTTKKAGSIGLSTTANNFGTGKTYNNGSNVTDLTTNYVSTTTVGVVYQSTSTGQVANVTSTAPFTYAASMTINVEFEIPILGWSSGSRQSDGYDGRQIAFTGSGTGSTQSLTANVTNISATVVKDTAGAWTGSTFVVPSAGSYQVAAFLYATASFTSQVHINGTFYKYLLYTVANTGGSGSMILPDLKVGDIISLRSSGSVTLAGDQAQSISINKIQSPQTISAGEEISLRYTNTAGTAIGVTTAILPFATRTFDTHNVYASGEFTAPTAGRYSVNVKVATAAVTLSTIQSLDLNVHKNGSFHTNIARTLGTGASNSYTTTGSDDFDLIAGDKLSIFANAGAATSVNTAAGYSYITIKRIK